MLCAPRCEEIVFLLATAKEENAPFRIMLQQLFYYLMHQSWRISLALMGRKGRNAYPLFEGVLHAHVGWQHVEVSTLWWEDAVELYINRITQFCKDIDIVLERCRLLGQLFMRG